VVDLVGQGRVKITERIIRQGGKMDDGIDPVELGCRYVAQLIGHVWHRRHF
jgi:hypothetical protein